MTYEKTREFSKDLRTLGCGDLDIEGIFLFFTVNMKLQLLMFSINNSVKREYFIL